MPETISPNIALLGAAGATGTSIAAALRQVGRAYRVVGRNRTQLEKSFGKDKLAEIVTWNTDDTASLRSACRGIETVIYLIGVPYNHFELHPVLMQKILDAAIAEGVKRFVLIGTVYPYGRAQTPTVTEEHPREPHTFKGRMRKAQEDILLTAHREGRIQGTILRLPDFYGPDVSASFLHSVFQAAVKGGTADMVGPIDLPHQFVYTPDIGPIVLALAEKNEAYGHWWNYAGSGLTTQREMAVLAFSAAGRKPKLRVVGKTMLRILGLFNPIMRELVEMHYLVTEPLVMDDSALRRLLGTVPATPYPEAIRSTFEAYKATANNLS